MRFTTIFMLMLALVLGGCVSQQDRDLISTAAAVGVGDLRDWSGMTDDQQRAAHHRLTKAFVTLDYTINGRDILPEFADAAPVESGSGR